MQTTDETPPPLPLGDTLKQLLQTEDTRGLSIREITGAVGEKGFGLVLIVLSLPSALPVPAPGYSTPFGIVIALIALQMIRGRTAVWLPAKLSAIRIKPKLAHTMLGSASKFLHAIERFIRPRQKWIRSHPGQAGLAVVIAIMACLMMLPIPIDQYFPRDGDFYDRCGAFRRGRAPRHRSLRSGLLRRATLRRDYLPRFDARRRSNRSDQRRHQVAL